MPAVYRAAWIVTGAGAPIADGWVSVADGRIAALGNGEGHPSAFDLGRVAILPALVNAHTHLELSFLRGLVPPAACVPDWARTIIRLRREQADPGAPAIVAAAEAALAEARATGTGVVGDVSNTLVTVPSLSDAGVRARVFYELLGFDESDPAGRVAAARARIAAMAPAGRLVRLGLAPHAPYSVSPGLFEAIRADVDANPPRVTSVHLGESVEEVELLARGTGAWREILQELGVCPADWSAPGVSPVAYLERLGFLDGSVLAVHAVQLEGGDLARLRALGATIVCCPRSNQHVGAGAPPLDAFYAMGVRVAFGTDSLASVADLNLFAELAEARRIAPRVPARRLIESATRSGAAALGFEEECGSLEAGKAAALIAVRVPEGVGDVEEYLVSGVGPDAIAWLDGGP